MSEQKLVSESIFDFKKVKVTASPVVLTTDWILSRVTDAQIFFHYYGRFKLGTACKVAFRLDKHMSATFFIGKSGEIVYYDFRDNTGMNCFQFVKKVYNVDFNGALKQIASDFGLIDRKSSVCSPKMMDEGAKLDRELKRDTLIQFTVKPWSKAIGGSLSYWNLYEITQGELERDGIYCVDRLFLNKVEIKNPNNYHRFARCETYGDNQTGVKIYSPHDKEMKWLNSIPLDVPFGINTLNTTSNLVMVTKSFKDRVILLKLFDSVIATQNESEGALPNVIISMLDQLFDKKVIVFDNDEVGVTNSRKFNEKGFGYFNIPEKERLRFNIKDPADYVATYGVEALRELFVEKNLLNHTN